HAGKYRLLSDFSNFIESETTRALSLGRVKILIRPDEFTDRDRPDMDWIEDAFRTAETSGVGLLSSDELRRKGYDIAYPLHREGRNTGLMLIEASASALTPDVRAVLEVLAGQVGIA